MSATPPPIVIVGSINMDLVARARHIPAPGETVMGGDFSLIPGGKGANQAVGVARLGGRVFMVGRLGDDDFGTRLRAGLEHNGVDVTHVRDTPGSASGVAMIVVAENGENAITVAPGANAAVTPEDVDAAESLLREARACLIQLELPLSTVLHALRICRRHGVTAILDPAPAPAAGAPEALFAADVLTPNETEAALLSGASDGAPPAAIAAALRRRGASAVVLKLGARGAHVAADDFDETVPGFPVTAVDTTAAGDAFTAALAVALADDLPPLEAARFANAAGALACTRHGAQPSLPHLEEVHRLVGRGHDRASVMPG